MVDVEGDCHGHLREGCDFFQIYRVGRAADFRETAPFEGWRIGFL